MKRRVRITILSIASLVVLGVAGWLLAGWGTKRAFESAFQNGGFSQLSDVLEATVGATLARSDSRLQLGPATNNAAPMEYYRRNPQQLQLDKKYFQTWRSALAIADSSRAGGYQINGWQSSRDISWIPVPSRTDSWGHNFCVQSTPVQAIVVSPGPQALTSLDCRGLKLPEEELAKMPEGRLNPHASGGLILVVRRAVNDKTGAV